MNTVPNLVLNQPAPFFGAVKGERKLTRRWFVWTAVAALLVILAATSKPLVEVFHISLREQDSGMYPTMWIFVVIWLFGWFAYTEDVLSAHEKKYSADIKCLRREYFIQEVCPYLARRYDAQINDDAARWLSDGYTYRVSVQGETRKVRLDGIESVKRFAMGDISHFYPEDLILEEVIEPAVTRYVPLKPVV